MYDNVFSVKAHGSPCGKVCPDRTATCRKTCERFRKYDAERLERDAKHDMYAAVNNYTDGQRKRHIMNVKYQKLHTQGKL